MAVFPLARPVYKPAMRVITAITGVTFQSIIFWTITTELPHGYLEGLTVRLNIPVDFGAQLLNGTPYTIVDIPSATQFTIAIDNTIGAAQDPFVIPASSKQSATVTIIGETDFQLYQAIHNVLPNG